MNMIGIVFGIGCIVTTMIIEGSHPSALLDVPAFIVVVGSAFGCTLVQFTIGQALTAFKHMLWLAVPPHVNMLSQAELLTGMSTTARQQGLLALESSIGSANDDFTRTGIQMIVDGVDKDVMAQLLHNAIDIEQEHLEPNVKYFESMGGYAPTMGIIGAVLGLIHAMGLLDRPDLLGPSIAVAFVATIYGLILANMICLPGANRIKTINAELALFKYMTLEGLVSITSGENTMMLKRRLAVYTGVPPE